MIILFLAVKMNVQKQKQVFKFLLPMRQLSVPQKDTPTGGCPGNDRNVRMDCGRRTDGSEVHVPEGNGGDVGRCTVKFNLRGEGER